MLGVCDIYDNTKENAKILERDHKDFVSGLEVKSGIVDTLPYHILHLIELV